MGFYFRINLFSLGPEADPDRPIAGTPRHEITKAVLAVPPRASYPVHEKEIGIDTVPGTRTTCQVRRVNNTCGTLA
jgi:hypothetical protein